MKLWNRFASQKGHHRGQRNCDDDNHFITFGFGILKLGVTPGGGGTMGMFQSLMVFLLFRVRRMRYC